MRVRIDESGGDDAVEEVDCLVGCAIEAFADVDDRVILEDNDAIAQMTVLVVLGCDDVGSVDPGPGWHLVSLDTSVGQFTSWYETGSRVEGAGKSGENREPKTWLALNRAEGAANQFC